MAISVQTGRRAGVGFTGAPEAIEERRDCARLQQSHKSIPGLPVNKFKVALSLVRSAASSAGNTMAGTIDAALRRETGMAEDARAPEQAHVWVWLPGRTEPAAAGRLEAADGKFRFRYDPDYLARDDAIALYAPELSLEPGLHPAGSDEVLPSCLRDAGPDWWGQYLLALRLGREPSPLECLLEVGSDRIGALDFQAVAGEYVPRLAPPELSLAELQAPIAQLDMRDGSRPEFDPALERALASVGGMRPKALYEEDGRKFIAKFVSHVDSFPVLKGEFLAMRLAAACGMRVAPVELREADGKEVLLVERFDRARADGGWSRRAMVSALTLFLSGDAAPNSDSYISYTYVDLADILRARAANPEAELRELFARLCFNILCTNIDDHARNHAAFWDGRAPELTPAYDICPQRRVGGEASQAMGIVGMRRRSQLRLCLDVADRFLLSEDEAQALVRGQVETVGAEWKALCDEAGIGRGLRSMFAGRQFLNPFAFEGLDGDRAGLAELGAEALREITD